MDEKKALFFTAATCFPPEKNCKIFSCTFPEMSGGVVHSHDYMQVMYVTKGRCSHQVEGKTQELLRGDAFILPPFMSHVTTLRENSEIICCEFSLDNFLMLKEGSTFSIIKEPLLDLSFMNYFMDDSKEVKPKLRLSSKNQEKTEQLLREMLREYNENSVYCAEFLRVYILELLLLFAREYTSLSNQKENTETLSQYKAAVKKSIHYIDKHYMEPLTLEMVCKYSTISKTYFCYLFKLLTQKTFVEYLMSRRIKQAMKLLSETDLPVTKICYQVGFNDLTHFSRTFKKAVGVSARIYRSGRCYSENGQPEAASDRRSENSK